MSSQTIKSPKRYVREREVLDRVRISRSTLHAWCQKGLFPLPVKISDKSIRWVESDVDAWMASRQLAAWG